MKELTMNREEISGMGEKPAEGFQDRRRSEFASGWRRFFKRVMASCNGPFESDWEKNAGLHWREWGKL